MVAIRKVERFLGELKPQQIHRLFFGTSADFWSECVDDDDDGSDQERTTVLAVDRCEGKFALLKMLGE